MSWNNSWWNPEEPNGPKADRSCTLNFSSEPNQGTMCLLPKTLTTKCRGRATLRQRPRSCTPVQKEYKTVSTGTTCIQSRWMPRVRPDHPTTCGWSLFHLDDLCLQPSRAVLPTCADAWEAMDMRQATKSCMHAVSVATVCTHFFAASEAKSRFLFFQPTACWRAIYHPQSTIPRLLHGLEWNF